MRTEVLDATVPLYIYIGSDVNFLPSWRKVLTKTSWIMETSNRLESLCGILRWRYMNWIHSF